MNKIKRFIHWQNLLTILLFAPLVPAISAQAQQSEALTVYAKGHGSIVSTFEERKIAAALVVLRPNGTALITLFSDLQLHAEAQWTASESSSQEIDLKITGGELSGNVSGSGKLVLTDDGKSIKELLIKSKSFDGRDLTLTFVAEAAEAVRVERVNVVSFLY